MIATYDDELFDLVADIQTVRILICTNCNARFETDVRNPDPKKGNWHLHEGEHWACCPQCSKWKNEITKS